MATIQFLRVCKRYAGDAPAVHDFNLTIGDGELMVLVGPSGCGKSTLLRLVAGLEATTSGELRIGGRVVNDLPPQERDIAMVFQNYALYPHKTVRKNLEFPLQMSGWTKGQIKARVAEVARLIGLDAVLERKPAQLSGGQRQRVAMGRALVREPAVFLMDEPLSNLDAQLRGQMRREITALQKKLRTTTIYVTHDQVEAMTMGDRLAVLNQGRLQQVGTPRELYEHPANVFVATFLGSPRMNLFESRVVATASGAPGFRLGPETLPLPDRLARQLGSGEQSPGDEIIIGVRPEAFSERERTSASPVLRVRVIAVEAMGHDQIVYFDAGIASLATTTDLADAREPQVPDHSFAARLPANCHAEPGQILGLHLDLSLIYVFDRNGVALPAGTAQLSE